MIIGHYLVIISFFLPFSQLDAASEESDIDSILDKQENMAIINASNWSPVRAITIVSKADLLQELVYSEVID